MVEEEGLFKKRINQIDFPCYEWSEDDSPEKIKEELCVTIEEARKEFPMTIEHVFIDSEGKMSGFKIKDVTIHENSDVIVANLIDAFGRWFLKWFGS
jgi:hypothetical protein